MAPPTLCYFCNKIITVFSGKSRDAIITHHLNGNGEDNRPENLVSAHQACHSSHHNKKENRGPEWGAGFGVTRRKLIKSFKDNPICYFCQDQITKLNGQDSDSLCIHHINNNHNDNKLENLVPSHIGCHMSYHSEKRRVSLETCQKISQALIGHVVLEETKQKLREANLGKIFSNQHKQNLSIALTGRIFSIEHIEKLRDCVTSEENPWSKWWKQKQLENTSRTVWTIWNIKK